VFGFRLNYPSEVVTQLRSFGAVATHWAGGLLLAFAVLTAVGLWHARSESRVLLALIPLANLAFYLFAAGAKPHYLIASVGMLFGVASFGALELWRRSHAVAALVSIAALVTLAMSAKQMHRDLLAEPDPRPLLESVRANHCAVTYADFWIAYRYRLLDEERGAWIPYLSQNRTRAESVEMQKRQGQRCLVTKELTVIRIAGDLPLAHRPPRSRDVEEK
jgi:hypothetical protein